MPKMIKALTDLAINGKKAAKGDIVAVESPYAASCLVRGGHAEYYDGAKDADVTPPVRAAVADPTDGPPPLPSKPKAKGR